MKISPEQAEVLEEAVMGPVGDMVRLFIQERIDRKTRTLIAGKLSFEEYQAQSASIRELEYLRDQPMRLIREAMNG